MAALSGSTAVAGQSGGDIRFSGQHTIVEWAVAVLQGLGIQPSTGAVAALVTWANHESGGYNPNLPGGLNNPLNTTQPGHGGTGGGAQGNIMDYPTFQDGVDAIVENLQNPRFGYPKILDALRGGNPQSVFAAVDASNFGTHNLTGSQVSTAGITNAQLAVAFIPSTNIPNLTGPLSGFVQNLPFIGPLVKGAKATQALAGMFLHLGDNWRYVLEILGGMAIMTVGAVMIFVDVTNRRGGQLVGQVAKAAA